MAFGKNRTQLDIELSRLGSYKRKLRNLELKVEEQKQIVANQEELVARMKEEEAK